MESRSRIAIQFSTAQRAARTRDTGQPSPRSAATVSGRKASKYGVTGYCAARLPLTSSTPSRPGGILLSIISKKKKCSSGGEGSNEGQLSWRFDAKDSAGAKQKIGREKNKKKKEAESWKAGRHSITLCAITLSNHIFLSEVVSLVFSV